MQITPTLIDIASFFLIYKLAADNSQVCYGHNVSQERVYLSPLDLGHLALRRGKELVLCFLEKDKSVNPSKCTFLSFKLFLENLLPDHDFPDLEDEPDMSSRDTWIIWATRADFQPVELKDLASVNHFVPVWHRSQIPQNDNGQDDFEVVMKAAMIKHSKQKQSLEGQIKDIQEKNHTDEEDEAKMASLMDQLDLLQKEVDARELFKSYGCHFHSVEADGNCGLWTVLALLGGLRETPHGDVYIKDENKMLELREDNLCVW